MHACTPVTPTAATLVSAPLRLPVRLGNGTVRRLKNRCHKGVSEQLLRCCAVPVQTWRISCDPPPTASAANGRCGASPSRPGAPVPLRDAAAPPTERACLRRTPLSGERARAAHIATLSTITRARRREGSARQERVRSPTRSPSDAGHSPSQPPRTRARMLSRLLRRAFDSADHHDDRAHLLRAAYSAARPIIIAHPPARST